MPEVSKPEWEAYLRQKPNPHLLQTPEWGSLKSAFGWEPIRVIADGLGVQILVRRITFGLTLAYIPKPCLASQVEAYSQALWVEVDAACRRRGAIFCLVEPDQWDQADQAEPGSTGPMPADPRVKFVLGRGIQPRRTMVVDLGAPEDQILARMKPKCRYNIRLAEKKGVSVEPWDDLDEFHRMMEQTGSRDAFGVHSRQYYRRAFDEFHPQGDCELLVARHARRPLAALMVFARGNRAWYLYGGSTDLERERMPNYLLQWEAMRWARRRGCTEYDLWGVPDADLESLESEFAKRSDGLWGVYRFKRGFGGELRRAIPAGVRVYRPLLHSLYARMARRQEAA
jgi:peptidoglycan pentaglycine glycine transferase (the first glycine)